MGFSSIMAMGIKYTFYYIDFLLSASPLSNIFLFTRNVPSLLLSLHFVFSRRNISVYGILFAITLTDLISCDSAF